ncbi:MAG: Gldg family protein [Candidatus Heimdallarchaeota archaeon]
MKIFFDETQKERGKINTNYSMLRDSLRGEGFEVEIYNDFPISEKSLKCDIFVFACPDGSKLDKNELEAILMFVEKGGSLLVIGNAGGDRGLRTNMNEILNSMSIEMYSDQVKDETNNEFNMPTHPVIKDIKDHPITQGVSEIVIVAGCSVRSSGNIKGVAYTSPAAEPPNTPVVAGGEYKSGRVVAVGSYRLFSNYGAEK